MARSATDVMHDILFAAVLDAVGALRAASGGVPNMMVRDLNAIHANTTFADLPEPLQKAINDAVRSAFTRLLKEGYSVTPGRPAPPPRTGGPQRPASPPRGAPGTPRHPRRPSDGKPPRGGPNRSGPRGGAR